MGLNVIYNDTNYSLMPKQKETYDKYCKIIQWGRQNPTRFIEQFFQLSLTDYQKYVILSSWVPSNVTWLCSRNTGKSFMMAVFVMAKTVLFSNHNTYIMAPSGGQAQESFSKIESIAKGQIASLVGVSSIFLDEAIRANSKTDCFVHDQNSYHCELYNGSTINSLNSVAKNIVGIRSNLNVYDEAGKVERQFFALTTPFTAQNKDFITGGNINSEIMPRQLQNQTLLLSSAEGVSSYLFDSYKNGFMQMLLGNPEYFVCDLDCSHSLHPFLDGKPMAPLIQQTVVDNAFATDPYKAQREYMNKFDADGGDDILVKRSTLNKNSIAMNPVYENDGTKKYIITYDPSTRLDNSVILVSELFRDEQKGLMLKFVNMISLVEVLKNGEKLVMQKPEQVERLKETVLKYNRGYVDYEGIDSVIFDDGAGGGGFESAQYLLNPWSDASGKLHRGFIDLENEYMKLRADDYVGNAENLILFNFTRSKTAAYQALQDSLNQGLVILPKDLNIRGEIEFEETNENGEIVIKNERATQEELATLTQFSLMKTELLGINKVKKPNGTITFEASPEAKQQNLHDDRADVAAMACWRLAQLRAEEALQIEHEQPESFNKLFSKRGSKHKVIFEKKPNPFMSKRNGNPFAK